MDIDVELDIFLSKQQQNVSHVQNDQEQVHGKLFKWFFGIKPDQHFVGAAFSVRQDKFKCVQLQK